MYCVCVCVCGVCATMCAWKSETIFVSQFSPTMWVSGIEVRPTLSTEQSCQLYKDMLTITTFEKGFIAFFSDNRVVFKKNGLAILLVPRSAHNCWGYFSSLPCSGSVVMWPFVVNAILSRSASGVTGNILPPICCLEKGDHDIWSWEAILCS